MEKSELVVELGVEEIPSSMLEDASRQFADILLESLKGQRLATGFVTRWYTPRRIIVGIRDIPLRQDDLSEAIIGPPRKRRIRQFWRSYQSGAGFCPKERRSDLADKDHSDAQGGVSVDRAKSAGRENAQAPRTPHTRIDRENPIS